MLCGKVRVFYSPPASLEPQSSQRRFFFFSAEKAEKKKIYALKLSKKHSRVIK
jgi:hypothetical protein